MFNPFAFMVHHITGMSNLSLPSFEMKKCIV